MSLELHGDLIGSLLGEVWEFPKIGDPNIVPQIVGSLLSGPENKVSLLSETPM